MSETSTLNCLVLGQDVHTIFPIEVPNTKSIGALKKLIKQEKSVDFVDVDADVLILYKVSLPIDERLEHELQKLPLGQPLIGARPLSKVFSTVDEENLHVVVRPPPHTSVINSPAFDRLITLNCLVYGQNVHTIFPVKISNTESIGALKKLIKQENPVEFLDVDSKALALYKVSFPIDKLLEHNVQHLDGAQPLIGAWKLSRVFSNHEDDEKLHVLIDVPHGQSGPSHTL
ncbi:hypothetical protein BU15DRAFT_51519 [Melanogaster broomeanus]|nr:hypothetical protein BU15DRAFT_51519 [Melanogaster broomeanus]